MPQVEGLPLNNARERLAGAGFQVKIQILERYNANRDDLVYTQDPRPDTLLAQGSFVRLIVYPSKAKASQTTHGLPPVDQVSGGGAAEVPTVVPLASGVQPGETALKPTPQKK